MFSLEAVTLPRPARERTASSHPYDVPDRRGLYDSYAECIDIRNNNPELFAQDAGYSLQFSGWSLGRYFHSNVGGKELHLLVNPQVDKELVFDVSFGSTNAADYYVASKSYGTEPSYDVASGKVTVPANSYVLIVNQKVTNAVDEIKADLEGCQPVSEAWYTLTGTRVDLPSKGIYIHVVDYADGTRRSFKQVIR